jgi:hypothetical protein
MKNLTRNQKALLIWFGLLVIVLISGSEAPAALMLYPTLIYLADLAGSIASRKGRSYWGFFIFSLILPLITLMVALGIRSNVRINKAE